MDSGTGERNGETNEDRTRQARELRTAVSTTTLGARVRAINNQLAQMNAEEETMKRAESVSRRQRAACRQQRS
jgi:hypothetical protein